MALPSLKCEAGRQHAIFRCPDFRERRIQPLCHPSVPGSAVSLTLDHPGPFGARLTQAASWSTPGTRGERTPGSTS